MNTEYNINAIKEYYGISRNTALYIYYRFLRSKRTDDKYLPWTLQFQNALVYADKILGIDWINLKFEDENMILDKNGVDIDEIDNNTIFKWTDKMEQNNEWIQVSRKKKYDYKHTVKKLGLFV